MTGTRIAICDLDGTLIDSDVALASAFISLGVPSDQITYGHVLADECLRWGITVEQYLDAYDATLAQPFAGVEDLVASFDVWAVCSNKHPRSGHAELERLGWAPTVAMFADTFDGPKHPGPVLHALGIDPSAAVFVGDTRHDRACAADAGLEFVLAGWNPRATETPGDVVLRDPSELRAVLGRDAQSA